MKKLLILLFPIAAHAQQPIPANIDSFSFVYTDIQQVRGVSAKIIQSRARLFIAQTFLDPSEVTKYDDTDGGIFSAVCTVSIRIKRPKDKDSINFGAVSLPMTLLFRNGKYKYEFSQISHQGDRTEFYNGGLLTNKVPADRLMEKSDWQLIRLTSPAYIQAFIDRLNGALQSDDLDPDKSDF